jgi:uncharacterized membrane protein (UPF0127 family)
MPIPIFKFAQGTNPFDPSANSAPASPELPPWHPSYVRPNRPQDDTWDRKLPPEQTRLKNVLAKLNDKNSFIINVALGDEGLPVIQAQLHDVNSSLQEASGQGFGLEKPAGIDPTVFNNNRYGLNVTSLDELEARTIGALPFSLITLAREGLKINKDLLPQELAPNRHGRIVAAIEQQNAANRNRRLRLKMGPNDTPTQNEELVDDQTAERMFAAAYRTAITEYIEAQGLQFPQARDENAPQPDNEIPFDLETLYNVYIDYLEPEYRPLCEYAKAVSRSLARKPDAAVPRILAGTRPGEEHPTSAPMDYPWNLPAQEREIEEAAKGMFFAGKPTDGLSTMFVNLNSIPGDQFFTSRSDGSISPKARELISRIAEHANTRMQLHKHPKLVLISRVPIKTENQGKQAEHPSVATLTIQKPDALEIEKVSMKNWVLKKFAVQNAPYAATLDGQPVQFSRYENRGGRQVGIITDEAKRFIREMTRFANGFSATAMENYLETILLETASEGANRIAPANGQTQIDIRELAQKARERYVETLFSQTGGAGGSQLKEMFEVVDAKQKKPKNMVNTANMQKVINEYQKALKAGDGFDLNGKKSLREIGEAAKALGLNIASDLGYPTSRYKKTPDGQFQLDAQGNKIPNPAISPNQKCWDELNENDLPEVRSKVPSALAKKKRNFIFLYGPGGMGKTSTAYAIADALNFGFVTWHLGSAKNMWVGNTEANLRAAFNFIKSLRDYVILMDEVDGVLAPAEHSHQTTNEIVSEFKNFTTELEKIAATNNIIIVSTTNHFDRMKQVDAAVLRRLGHDKAEHVDYYRDPKMIENLASGIIDRKAGDPMYPTFQGVKTAYAHALAEQAARNKPYSNDEIGRLFEEWVRWNRDTVIPEFGEEYMFKESTLRYMVQNSRRQSVNGDMEAAYPPKDFILNEGKIPAQDQQGAFADPNAQVPGFTPVEVPRPGQMAPAPAIPGRTPSRVPSNPTAADVDLSAFQDDAEDTLLPPAQRPGNRPPPRGASTNSVMKEAAFEKTAKIKLISIAEHAYEQSQGLKYVRQLPEMSGMLFKYQSPRHLSFWMQDTYLPLDIAFIDENGKIVKTERMIPMSTRSVTSGTPCVMALEVPAGTLSKVGGIVGKKVNIDFGEKSVQFHD